MMIFKRLRKAVYHVCLGLMVAAAGLPLGLTIDASPASAATSFSNIAANTTTPAMYDKYELTFNLGTTYTNPFDPGEVDLTATITTPSGQTEVVPGFYKQNSSPNWAIRYSPRQIGSHSVVIRVADANGIGYSPVYTFNAGAAGSNRGFMGVEGNRFIDSYGSQLTLIGQNFAWNNTSDPVAAITEMPNLKPAKMNVMRVWYSCWWSSFSPEWKAGVSYETGLTTVYEGLGRYQLDNQARVDQLLQAAEANNVYIMLTLRSFGDFYYQWNQNAYNQANGGTVTWSDNNTNFWTDPTAINYQKKLLRYMFARFGYSRAFGMLEYWNEMDNHIDTSNTNRASWTAEVDNYWKGLDFYNHPTTTSFAWKDHAGSGQVSWQNLTTLDVTNLHRYDSSANVVDVWENEVENLQSIGNNRPAFFGEIGRTHNDVSTDATIANYLHNSLWGPMFRAGAAGGSLWWTFEGFAIPASFKAIFTRFANFIQPEEQYLINMPHVDYGLQSNNTKIGGFKSGTRAMLWINDTQANHTVTSPRTVSGMSYTLAGMTNGNYHVTYYNTYSGTTISTSTATASGGSLTLSIPSFSRDIALKIAPQAGSSDQVPPSAPSNLASPAKTSTTVDLTWVASTDDVGVTGYGVYQGSTLVGTTSSSSTSFQVTGLTANTNYTFTVKAKDAAGNESIASNAVSVTTHSNGGGTGSITREYWSNISGNYISAIPLHTAPTGTSALTSLEGPTNAADNYGTRIRGYITPSVTGSYTFHVAGDDESELWLSTDSNPANKVKIATVTGWTNSREWSKYASQQSAAKSLTAGQQYYVEVLHKEGNGGDNIAVGWTGPGIASTTVIAGSYLSPYSGGDTVAPSAPTSLSAPSKTSSSVSLSWSAATDNVGVIGYDIYNGPTLAGSTTGALAYTVTDLTANTAYTFTVKAKDAAGNVSGASNSVTVTTNASGGGGSNLLANPGFETSNGNGKPASWTCEQDYYCSLNASVKRSGTSSLKVEGNTGPWFAVYQSVAGTAGNAYTLSGYVNLASNNGTKIDVKVQFLNSSGSVLSEHAAASYNGNTTSVFVNVAGTYTAPSNTSNVRVYIYFRDMRATMYYDDFSLTVN